MYPVSERSIAACRADATGSASGKSDSATNSGSTSDGYAVHFSLVRVRSWPRLWAATRSMSVSLPYRPVLFTVPWWQGDDLEACNSSEVVGVERVERKPCGLGGCGDQGIEGPSGRLAS